MVDMDHSGFIHKKEIIRLLLFVALRNLGCHTKIHWEAKREKHCIKGVTGGCENREERRVIVVVLEILNIILQACHSTTARTLGKDLLALLVPVHLHAHVLLSFLNMVCILRQ